MILAGLLLKLGGCGLYRFVTLMPSLFSGLNSALTSYLLLGMVLSGLICSLQSDLKRLVAYSSVVHITSVGLLYLLDRSLGLSASLILIVLHGISSPLIFYMVGEIYELTSTRLLLIVRSIKFYYPVLYLCMVGCFYLTVPVPPALSFLGEVYLFTRVIKYGLAVCVV